MSFDGTYESGIQSFFWSFARVSESTSSFFILDSAIRLIFYGFPSLTANPWDSMKS
jgi:hypothetical protein